MIKKYGDEMGQKIVAGDSEFWVDLTVFEHRLGWARVGTHDDFDVYYELKRYYAQHSLSTGLHGFDTIHDYISDYCDAKRERYRVVYYQIRDVKCTSCATAVKRVNSEGKCDACVGRTPCEDCGTYYTDLRAPSGELKCSTCTFMDVEFEGMEGVGTRSHLWYLKAFILKIFDRF